jgi:AMMECR1 domain-containing protein/orotate phosphoribosyltransferase
MFYSWNVSLTAEGGALAARCLLDHLEGFESTQLATYGTTGIPLLAQCVLLGEGRYSGICVREQPKGHSGGRQIEGPADLSRPVVLIDDSLSSGTSFLNGARLLERHGFRVEGGICLVHFPHRGGRERAEALGYRVETLFDIWEDLQMPRPTYIPGFRRVGEFTATATAVQNGLSPAQVARCVAEHLLQGGTLPAPPQRLNAEHNALGGTWVSFRDRRTNVRVARDGFWHFNPEDADPCRDVVLATAKTIRTGGLRLEQLDDLKIAVTFFGRLEAVRPAELEFARYGIVVRSTVWPVKIGGALPNTQVFISEREQLDLALRNASLSAFEPYEIYRHTVRKHLEQNVDWLPYGAPDGSEYAWTGDRMVGQALTTRAREVALAVARGDPLPPISLDPGLIPTSVAAVGVTLYHRGVIGCSISSRGNLDQALVAAAQAAVEDDRFGRITPDILDELCPAVSILYDPEWIGSTSARVAARKLRLGRDSLAVRQGDRQALFLESVGPYYDWSKELLAQRLLQKAQATDGPVHWITYRTATWLHRQSEAVQHHFGFAGPPAGPCDVTALRDDLLLLGGYIERNLLSSGLPRYAQSPMISEWRWDQGSAARIIHGLSGLLTAGELLQREDWKELARTGLQRCIEAVEIAAGSTAGTLRLEGQRCGPMADCELLAAAAFSGCSDRTCPQLDALAAGVAAMFRADGSIHPDRQPVRIERDNDYLPNAAILALAAHNADRSDGLAPFMEPYRSWQLRRFRLLHGWGQAGWLPQACAKMFLVTGDPTYAATAFEVADWCIDWQIEATGAFLTDLSPDGPSFHTAFIAEAIADAWHVAMICNDLDRVQQYEGAWWGAMRFARQLIIRPVDAPCVPDPSLSIGGVRGSLTTSTIRIDYVSHLAIAISKGLKLTSHSTRS